MSIRQGSNIISGAKSKELGLLTPQWYDYVLDDINWIRADNFSWHKGTIYTATYQHLLKDIDGKATQTETIEGTTITFYLADDGHKIVDRSQEAAVQTIYENTGISWYYIIDRNNSLFKLPRSRFDIYGGSQVQAENMCLYFYAGNFAQSLDENNPTSPITGETNWGEIGGILSDQTDLQNALDEKAFLTDIGDATLTIQKNATTIDTFTANSKTNKTINIVVPTTPQEVNALPDTTKYAANVSMTIDSSTYVVTLQLKDQDGSNIGSAQTIDLPIESVVVSGSYDSSTKEVVLTLENGSTIRFSVADLISGLQSEITSTNKLDADLVDDTTSAHKFVTASDKSTWNAKQDAISDLSTIRSNASAGKSASDTIATYGDIVTHDVSEFATSTQGGKADTAIQPGDNISELTNDAAYVQTLADLGITATAAELNALDGITASVSELNILDGATVTTAELNVLDGITASTTELNYTDGVTSNIQDQLDDKVAKNAAITGATKTKITYDSKGLVTAGDDLAESDIPSLHMSKISDVTATATELNYVGGVTSAIQTQIDSKVDKTSSASKVYGTDANGDQTTYDYDTFGKVDDVKVGTTSVVTNKIANLGTMAGETATNYYTKVAADGTFVKVNPTITGATKTKITYDAKGLVTAGDDLAESDIPSIHLSKVSDVTATAAEVNVLDGITASTAELNILDGVTATTTELNYVDGVTSNIQDQLDTKAVDSSVVHKTGAETITGAKTFENTDSTGASLTALTLKGDNLHKGTNPSTNHFNSIEFTDDSDVNIAKFSAIQTNDGWTGFLAGAGSDPTNPQNNLLMIANGNSKLLLIPTTSSHGSSAVRRDFFNDNAVKHTPSTAVGSSSQPVYIASDGTATACSLTAGDVGAVEANTAITGATKTKITYDEKGLVTAGDDLAESDIPSIHLSKISDVTATASEVNVLDGITATTAELNYLGGVTSNVQTQLDDKVEKNTAITGATKTKITYDEKGLVTAGADLAESDIPSLHLSKISDITATASEVNVLDGITATTTELNYVDGVTSSIQTQIDSKQAIISDLADIRSGAAAGATAVQPGDLATVATTGAYADLTGTPTIGNATLTIQKNGTDIDTFTANATVDQTINITVPTQASDVNALPDTTKYAASASLSINSSTYVITLQLKDQDDNNIGTAQTIDLPLESVVVSGSYDSSTKEVVLTLQDGSTIRFSVADLVSGLQSEITTTNKLDADLVDDSTSTNKFVTTSDKTTWNAKQDAITGAATTITSSDLTASKALISNASGKVAASTVTSTELGYVSGVTSAIQTQIDSKVTGNTAITGATKCKITYDSKGLVTAGADLQASDIPSLSLSKISDVTATAAELNVLDGITASTTELNYVDGVTSNIQTQIDSKQATISDLSDIRAGAAAGATALQPNTAITGATKTKITYDSNGLVTAGADLTASDIPSITLSKISDITATAAEVNVLDGVTATTAELNVLDGITASTTELNYVDGVTSSIQTQLDSKQATLVSGTNIKTINSTSLLGSGNITIHEGTYDYSELTNRPQVNSITLSGNKTSSDLGLQDALVSGTNIKTINNNSLLGSGNITIDSLPTQTGQSGKFLTTNGTVASWAVVDALPSQTGQSGKVLTTNGTAASWMDSPGATIRIWGENE